MTYWSQVAQLLLFQSKLLSTMHLKWAIWASWSNFWGLKLRNVLMGQWSISTNTYQTFYSCLTWLNLRLFHSISFQGLALKKEKAHLPWTALFIDSWLVACCTWLILGLISVMPWMLCQDTCSNLMFFIGRQPRGSSSIFREPGSTAFSMLQTSS